MMDIIRKLLRRDDRGTYIVEFAMISLPMFTLLLGAVEIGYYSYAKARTEGLLREVSRLASTGAFTTDTTTNDSDDDSEGGKEDADSGPTALELITEYIETGVQDIPGAEFDVDVRSYKSFRDIKQPEPLVSDVEPIGGTPGVGDCYIDVNDNDQWDEDIGVAGVGGAEDIVYFGLQVSYAPLFTLSKTFAGEEMAIDINAAIKNEPFANATQNASEEKCIEE